MACRAKAKLKVSVLTQAQLQAIVIFTVFE